MIYAAFQQPEVLRLADALDNYATGDEYQRPTEQAAAELRRLHAVELERNTLLAERDFLRAAIQSNEYLWLQYQSVKAQNEAGWDEVKRLAAERDRLTVEVCARRAAQAEPVGRVDGDGRVQWFAPIPEGGSDLFCAAKLPTQARNLLTPTANAALATPLAG